MAAASSSPSNQDLSATPPENPLSIVTVAAAAGSGAGAASSRRLPPPCWSHEETIALIDAYRDKWYSLRRGNLRANHWQEVADDVAVRCPVDSPKTAVQCRHKMEKLRKRYRAEIQRAAPYGGVRSHRYCSSWVLFKLMDAMERGTNAAAAASPPPDEEELEDDAEDIKQNSVKHIGDIYSQNNLNSNKRSSFQGSMTNGGTGVRIRIPTLPMAKPYSKFDEILTQNPNPNPNTSYGSSRMLKGDCFGKKSADLGKRVSGEEEVGEKRKADPIAEMVTAIKALGDGFLKMERMKMELARELEEMKMEMEMKRTEMILESQQRIVEAFANALTEKNNNNKKTKRMPTPECQMPHS
nr:trihelix transcription factor ASIL2-like [Ipomoea trifida]